MAITRKSKSTSAKKINSKSVKASKSAAVVEVKAEAAVPEKKKGQTAKNSSFGSIVTARPGRRRGRRPKGTEDYQPYREENEDPFVPEETYTGIQYDTGIKVADQSEDGGFNLDRMEDFDEELNFDW